MRATVLGCGVVNHSFAPLQGVVVPATGHGTLVVLAPVTGATIAALLRGEDDALRAPLAPGRFG